MVPSASCSFTVGIAEMAAWAVPDVLVMSRISFSVIEKYTSIAELLETVVRAGVLAELTIAPTL